MSVLATHSWPRRDAARALQSMTERRGLPAVEASAPADTPPIVSLAESSGLQATPVAVEPWDIEEALAQPNPLLVEIPGEDRILAVSACRGRKLTLETPSGPRRLPLATVAADLARLLGSRHGPTIERLDSAIGAPSPSRRDVLRRLLAEKSDRLRIWAIEPGPETPLRAFMRWRGLSRRLLAPIFTHALEYGIYIVGWWLIGRLALGGRIEMGWLLAWALLFTSWAPVRAMVAKADNRLAIDLGVAIRQRLLSGSLRLPPGEASRLGVGGIMGRVLETDALENVAVAGGVHAATSLLDLALVAVLIALGAGGLPHTFLLVVFALMHVALVGGYYRARRRWTDERNVMTGDLVEQMVGHRTRIAQDRADTQDEVEDSRLAAYHARGSRMDRWLVAINALPRLWIVASVLLLMPAFSMGRIALPSLAVAIGAMLLARGAFYRIALAAVPVSRALIAFRDVAPLLAAPEQLAPGEPGMHPSPDATLHAHDLSFHYPSSDRPVLTGQSLSLAPRARLLVEGPSGSGKSTLAALLTAAREPTGGVVLLDGYDRHTLGHRRWRRHVTLVPQFHDNHMVLGTLAFNLLMGRGWPPTREDIVDAERVCEALGLGPVISRMPAGLFQVVGEVGWQLSHGERSRVFLARALLQRPNVLVLDESLGALDPETLRRVGKVVLDSPSSVVAIAHP